MTAAARASSAKPVIGDGLLHPMALASIAVLIVNDHFLKAAYPGFVTGKLSDFAGLIFFPLLLTAVYEVASSIVGRMPRLDRVTLLAAIVGTGVFFAAIKLVPSFNDSIERLLGLAQWIFNPATQPVPTVIAMDATDLIALPMLAVAYVIGLRRTSSDS